MSFQTQTNQQPAIGIAGDFASVNPRHNVLSQQGAIVAGATPGTSNPSGLVCGKFAWLDTATWGIATNTGAGKPNGFVHNDHAALITQYLGEVSLVIPAGFICGDLFDGGDFFAKNDGTSSGVPGMKAYANNATGAVTFAASGGAPVGGEGTASTIAAGTATSVTASIASINPVSGSPYGLMTVTAVSTGALKVGGILSGSGVQTGTQITAQLTGSAGSTGTYQVTIPQTASSTTVTQAYGLLTVGGSVTGTFSVNDSINDGSTGVTAGTYITALGTGTGGAGTYIVNLSQTVGSTALIAQGATETDWYCASFALPGEVAMITTKPIP